MSDEMDALIANARKVRAAEDEANRIKNAPLVAALRAEEATVVASLREHVRYTYMPAMARTTMEQAAALIEAAEARATAAEARLADLEWLSGRVNLELSWGADGDADDGEWRIHQVSGGRSDREWTLIASAKTVEEAIRRARAFVERQDG